MAGFWDRVFGLDREHSLWVEKEDLGRETFIVRGNKRYAVRIPPNIEGHTVLRLKGLGRTRFGRTGDLLLHVWLNRGTDIKKTLWLSERSARMGAQKSLSTGKKTIAVIVPPESPHGLILRLQGLGHEPVAGPRAPALEHTKRGDLLVELCVYPDSITPTYGSFDSLTTEDMALEGWVYRKFDDVLRRLGPSALPAAPLQSSAIADVFNERGSVGIFDTLVHHLDLTRLNIGLTASASTALPGSCTKTALISNNVFTGHEYRIAVNEQFLSNPFATAAILAHELCHVVYSTHIDETPITTGAVIKSEKARLEEEHTVDLLVFMFRMGEFQLRVARDQRLTLGYFNQSVFERMQVIVARKLASANP